MFNEHCSSLPFVTKVSCSNPKSTLYSHTLYCLWRPIRAQNEGVWNTDISKREESEKISCGVSLWGSFKGSVSTDKSLAIAEWKALTAYQALGRLVGCLAGYLAVVMSNHLFFDRTNVFAVQAVHWTVYNDPAPSATSDKMRVSSFGRLRNSSSEKKMIDRWSTDDFDSATLFWRSLLWLLWRSLFFALTLSALASLAHRNATVSDSIDRLADSYR